MKEYAKSFYKSPRWRNTREAYAKSVGGLCEECLKHGLYNPGEIVHHIRPITPDNIDDPNVTLNWDNLILVCRECHSAEHSSNPKRYRIDSLGRVIISPRS